MNTREAAEQLKTDPKRLRRFLRQDPTYRNAGQGGRYEFTDKDIPTLRKRFETWVIATAKPDNAVAPARRSRKKAGDSMPVHIANVPAHKLTTKQREERNRLSRERVDRLEAALKAKGLHISQRQDA